MEEVLALLGFVRIAEVVDQRLEYLPAAAELAGDSAAVYLFVNP